MDGDIGAYKTEEIDHMMRFESEDVFGHSIYSYLFLKHMSPLSKWADVVLYHHLNYELYPRFGKRTVDLYRRISGQCDLRLDIMSALTGSRSYKKSFPKETVIEILQRQKAAGKLCERVIDTAVQYYDIIMESGRENIRMITEMYGCISSEFWLIRKRFEEVI